MFFVGLDFLEHANHLVQDVIVSGVEHFDDFVEIDAVVLAILLVPFVAGAHDSEKFAFDGDVLAFDETTNVGGVDVSRDVVERVFVVFEKVRLVGVEIVELSDFLVVESNLEVPKLETRLVAANVFEIEVLAALELVPLVVGVQDHESAVDARIESANEILEFLHGLNAVGGWLGEADVDVDIDQVRVGAESSDVVRGHLVGSVADDAIRSPVPDDEEILEVRVERLAEVVHGRLSAVVNAEALAKFFRPRTLESDGLSKGFPERQSLAPLRFVGVDLSLRGNLPRSAGKINSYKCSLVMLKNFRRLDGVVGESVCDGFLVEMFDAREGVHDLGVAVDDESAEAIATAFAEEFERAELIALLESSREGRKLTTRTTLPHDSRSARRGARRRISTNLRKTAVRVGIRRNRRS